MTREASDDKSILRQVHSQRRPCLLKEELAEGQLHQRLEKHQVTRQPPDDKRSPREQDKPQMARASSDRYTARGDLAY